MRYQGAFLAFSLLLAPAAQGQTSPAPEVPWTPPKTAAAPAPAPPPEIPAELLQAGRTVSLREAVDVALRNTAATRAAWFAARSAAANVGSKRSAYYPQVELDGNLGRQKTVSLGGQFVSLLTTYGLSASLTWLLLDLGGRSGDIDEARGALEAANYTQNAVIQNVVLQVATAFYQYQDARALREAAQASLKDAEANLEAATERHRAGVATIADVLQAKTARSSAQLALEIAEGRVHVVRGALATALGVPANVPVEAEELPAEVVLDALPGSVDPLIARALQNRPDLEAARASAAKAQSHVRSVRASGLPSLLTSANWNRSYFPGSDLVAFGDSYGAALLLRVPVFTGFQKQYDLRKAREDASAAAEQVAGSEQQVILDVWSSYYDERTAAQRVRTTRDLLASARESAEVAAGRYKAGVGSILDLLAAQSALASARAQEVQARADWLLSVATLARATGQLGPMPSAGRDGAEGEEGR